MGALRSFIQDPMSVLAAPEIMKIGRMKRRAFTIVGGVVSR